jgi:hypothetical protein
MEQVMEHLLAIQEELKTNQKRIEGTMDSH